VVDILNYFSQAKIKVPHLSIWYELRFQCMPKKKKITTLYL